MIDQISVVQLAKICLYSFSESTFNYIAKDNER